MFFCFFFVRGLFNGIIKSYSNSYALSSEFIFVKFVFVGVVMIVMFIFFVFVLGGEIVNKLWVFLLRIFSFVGVSFVDVV